MTDLQALKTELAAKQKAKEEATKIALEAEEVYTSVFIKWQIENAKIVKASTLADEQERVAKTEFKEARNLAIMRLSAHFAEHPDDKDQVDAFSFIRRKEVVWNVKNEVQVLVDAGASFLLKVDDGALQTFVNNMSEDKNGRFVLPKAISNWLPGLLVDTKRQGTVSDKKLQSD